MKRRSIGARLTAWYFVVFACGLAAFSIAAWFAMRASLYRAADDELRDRVRGVQRFMENQISSLSVAEIRDEFREHSVLGPGGDLFQVCDRQGEWLYRSVALENANVPITLPGALPTARFDNLQLERQILRFYSERIFVNGEPYTVEVATQINQGLQALERFRVILLFTAPLLLIAASLGGYWLSTRALAPFDEISQAAQRISIENLADRLPLPPTRDELHRLSETLNDMFSRLDESVRRIKEFTADASHELRAPISLIRTTAEIAVQRERSPEEYRKALLEILEESERTSEVVNSLMLLARADSAKEFLELVPADACAVVREAIDQGEKLARARSVSFSADVPGGHIPIRADIDALRRALLIFIDNAVKYTPASGSVRVTLRANDGFAVASVKDNGIGMTEEQLTHIFDRFWRADKARSRDEGGAGLGLSIAKWIVEMHRGAIEVESQPGKGSVFTVRVPMSGGTNQWPT